MALLLMDTDQVANLIKEIDTALKDLKTQADGTQQRLNELPSIWFGGSLDEYRGLMGELLNRTGKLAEEGINLQGRLTREKAEWEERSARLVGDRATNKSLDQVIVIENGVIIKYPGYASKSFVEKLKLQGKEYIQDKVLEKLIDPNSSGGYSIGKDVNDLFKDIKDISTSGYISRNQDGVVSYVDGPLKFIGYKKDGYIVLIAHNVGADISGHAASLGAHAATLDVKVVGEAISKGVSALVRGGAEVITKVLTQDYKKYTELPGYAGKDDNGNLIYVYPDETN